MIDLVEGAFFFRVIRTGEQCRRGRLEQVLTCLPDGEGLDDPGADVVGVGPARGTMGVKEWPVYDVFWADGWWRSIDINVQSLDMSDPDGSEMHILLMDRYPVGLGPPSYDKSSLTVRCDIPK